MARYWTYLLAIITAFSLNGCEQSPDELGLWNAVGDDGSIEFKSSGEIILVDNMKATLIGHYRRDANDSLEIEFSASNILKQDIEPIEPMLVQASIAIVGDELVISHGDGEKDIYQKAR